MTPKVLVVSNCSTDWRVLPNKKDYLTRGTGQQMVEKNCLWEAKCLPPKDRNPKCPDVSKVELAR